METYISTEAMTKGEMENQEIEEMKDESEVSKRLQPWTKQITLRGVIASMLIGSIFSVIAMKLNLTTGLTPSLNVSAALLAFVFMRTWTNMLRKAGIASVPFTRHENTMIQTCSVASYSIAVAGGFGSYLLGLNKKTYELTGVDTEGNSPGSYKEPGFGWMTTYLFLSCFVGLFVLIPLRKILIIDYKLTFPSGMATAVLINGFHARGDEMAKYILKLSLDLSYEFPAYVNAADLEALFDPSCYLQETSIRVYEVLLIEFLVGVFPMVLHWDRRMWLRTVPHFWVASLEANVCLAPYSCVCELLCSSEATALLNLLLMEFYFDFSLTYVGTGMICPHIVNLSLLFGAVLSWGLMWPLIDNRKGDWFPANMDEHSMKSINGYKVFISIALILGDGLYNFIKILYFTSVSIHGRWKQRNLNSDSDFSSAIAVANQNQAPGDLKKNEVFIRESIPMWIGAAGYVIFAIITTITIPFLFPELKWYYVVVAYIFAPSLAFCNAYGAGLTDFNMAYNYGKVGLFVLAALAGKEHGVVAGMVGCGLIKSVVSVSCILMQDLKTGHLTLTSPRTMLISQAIGTAIGCVISPLSFLLFYKAFDVGNPSGEFKAPYAVIYRNMAILGVQGFSALPQHCLQLCYGFFAFAAGINLVKDLSPPKIGQWMPLPMAMAVPFLVGGYFAIDMCVGTLVVFVWHKLNTTKAELMVPAVASGLICGEGLWILPASILALAKIKPPICMKFLAS
ncbi:hypothetical protein RJ639_003451 [Escallonia herrerae]|uniref:Metal-nicotianamine transporter YSL1 n=1 Tax=Escallonia herrerae TaxID=1293975 RepID=A0AA89AY13_9ASTE|nr:hypothetical protein RJ639_003451 [Escallonia herrerae]